MALKDDMQISDALMYECARQPMLFHKYAVDLADAQLDREKAKDHLDVTKAKIDEDIRRNPGKYSLDTEKKPTESAIANQVIQEADYQEANNSLMEAGHIVNKLGGAKEAMHHKKTMLESMVRLHIADWGSDPSMSTKGREAVANAGAGEHKAALPRPTRRLGKSRDSG
jgi:hypothetical protein